MRLAHYLTGWISILMLVLNPSEADEDHHKRTPVGFTGVRGKKSITDELYNAIDVADDSNTIQKTEDTPTSLTTPISIAYLIEKRAPSGFFGMRGKKPYNWYPEEPYKRAPMGFVGMRGKKYIDVDEYDAAKRAQMGFFGMRGKKWMIEGDGGQGKRAPMGFVGMRGKKDFESSLGYFEEKRAPNGFFGMRGKKQPSGFFGMRGKKYPYEFRGKFVGVRGKKSSSDIYPSNSALVSNDLDMNQLLLLLNAQNGVDSNNV